MLLPDDVLDSLDETVDSGEVAEVSVPLEVVTEGVDSDVVVP